MCPSPMSLSSASTELHRGQYTIQQLAARSRQQRFGPRIVKYLNLITWCLWLSSILVQIYFARLLQSEAPNFMWRIWTCLIAEICLSFQELVLAINLILVHFSVQGTSDR